MVIAIQFVYHYQFEAKITVEFWDPGHFTTDSQTNLHPDYWMKQVNIKQQQKTNKRVGQDLLLCQNCFDVDLKGQTLLMT